MVSFRKKEKDTGKKFSDWKPATSLMQGYNQDYVMASFKEGVRSEYS